jgi:hypothetical protein
MSEQAFRDKLSEALGRELVLRKEIERLQGAKGQEMTDLDDLRVSVEAVRDENDDLSKRKQLILDLWRAVQDARAEANAWKHANAMQPVTAEELTHALGNKPSFTLEVWVKAMLDELGPLYRQRKP